MPEEPKMPTVNSAGDTPDAPFQPLQVDIEPATVDPTPGDAFGAGGVVTPLVSPAAPEAPMSAEPQPVTPQYDVAPSTTPVMSAFGTAPVSPVETASSLPQPTTPSVAMPSNNFSMQQPPKSGKKGIIIGGVIAGALVLFGGSGALAYGMWYQNPDKVIADAVMNMVTGVSTTSASSVTTASISNKNGTGSIQFDLKGNEDIASGTMKLSLNITTPVKIAVKDVTVNLVATKSGDAYFQAKDMDKVADQVIDAYLETMASGSAGFGGAPSAADIAMMKTAVRESIDPVLQKINNKWIKLPADSADSEESKSQKCAADLIAKLKTNKAMSKELSKTYMENKFVVVKEKLPVEDGSLGYVLGLDTEKVNGFGKAVVKTAFMKELTACDPGAETPTFDDSDALKSEDNPFKSSRFELRVSRWSHKITGVKAEMVTKDESMGDGPTTMKFETKIDYGKVDGITAPTDAVDFETLQKDLESVAPSTGIGASAMPIEL